MVVSESARDRRKYKVPGILGIGIGGEKEIMNFVEELVSIDGIDFIHIEELASTPNLIASIDPNIIFLWLDGSKSLESIEFLKLLKSNPKTKDIPVIGLSYREDRLLFFEFLMNGGLEIFLYPFDNLIFLAKISQIIQTKEIINSMKLSIFKDELTGVYNRRFLKEKIKYFKNLCRYKGEKPFTIIFIDLDNFKSINDNYGHVIGDKVLSIFGNILRSSLRGTDVPVRWGGDEFVILLPYTGEAGARVVISRIRNRLKSLDLSQTLGIEEKVYIDFSVGGIVFNLCLLEKIDIEDVIKRADKLLYTVKKGREDRNRVKIEEL